MSRRNLSRARLLVVLVLPLTIVQAENIDPAADDSQFAYAENVGWINAEPSGDGGPGVQVGNFELTGWLWGENIGWISLSCQNTSSCGTTSYGVMQDSFGVLSGFAWSENVGWINFAPATSGVTIDPGTGNFSGYAWGENIGWISFNCSNTGTCGAAAYKVRTGWTCTATPPVGSPPLMLAKSGTDTILSWWTIPGAGRFDGVRGSLGALRSMGGNFTVATSECLANNQIGTSLSFAGVPSVGDGFWFLVRAVNCGGSGTYNSGSSTQIGDRDSEINASLNSCP